MRAENSIRGSVCGGLLRWRIDVAIAQLVVEGEKKFEFCPWPALLLCENEVRGEVCIRIKYERLITER